jgi:hypothetical protein
MKRIILGTILALAASVAFAGGGAGFYQHFNGTIKFFPMGNNGQAWTFLYNTPPVVPPVTPPVVTPPIVDVPETPPASTPTPAAAPAQEPAKPAQQASRGARPQYAAYVMIGIMAQYTLWVVCEKENIEWCKAPAWIRGPMTAPTPGEYTAHPFFN